MPSPNRSTKALRWYLLIVELLLFGAAVAALIFYWAPLDELALSGSIIMALVMYLLGILGLQSDASEAVRQGLLPTQFLLRQVRTLGALLAVIIVFFGVPWAVWRGVGAVLAEVLGDDLLELAFLGVWIAWVSTFILVAKVINRRLARR